MYGKCPKLSYSKVANKMAYANSVDPDEPGPEGGVWAGSTLFAFPLSILRNNCMKRKSLKKKKKKKEGGGGGGGGYGIKYS